MSKLIYSAGQGQKINISGKKHAACQQCNSCQRGGVKPQCKPQAPPTHQSCGTLLIFHSIIPTFYVQCSYMDDFWLQTGLQNISLQPLDLKILNRLDYKLKCYLFEVFLNK